MHIPDTSAAYDAIADRWLDVRFGRVDGLAQHERALAFLSESDGGWALNVGCGCSTRFNALFREKGLRIEGVDISERMIGFARSADADVVLHHADICEWHAPQTYRFISAWDSIWHVPLDAQRALMLKLMALLGSGGVLIFSAGGLDAPGEHVDSSMGPEVYYATLGIPGLLEVIELAGCVCRHLEFDQYPQKHLCVIVQKAR